MREVLILMFKKFGILGALSELLEPHLFGRTGALKFRNNWSAPPEIKSFLASNLPPPPLACKRHEIYRVAAD